MVGAESQVRHSLPGQAHAATLGMWIFLVTETLFVGALFAAYLLVRTVHPQGFILGSRETDIVLGSINTAVLLTSSLAMALAVDRLRADMAGAAARWMVATALLGLVFLGIKGVEYLLDWQHGLVPGPHFRPGGDQAPGMELFFFLYFLMTGVHALHLFIGIALVAIFAVMLRHGRFGAGLSAPVENLGLYWHFVDVVWIFLFPLLYLVHRT